MKQITALKLTCVASFVAALGVGCASTGYAQYDADSSDMNDGIGASASADIGTDRDSTTVIVDDDAEGEARATVSALSSNPETRATWVNKFPFYDMNWNMHVIETYTFAAPDPGLEIAASTDAPEFDVSLPPGSVYVEAAGGAGEVSAGRVIQHSPNPR